MTFNLTKLKQFIQIPSLEGNQKGNQQAINFVTDYFKKTNCEIKILGQEVSGQPSIIAHYSGHNSHNKIVIYGHYDVAPIKSSEQWNTQDPFILEEKDDRLYGRGIADNKGPLFARLESFYQLVQKNSVLPEILWLIQGEEEIENKQRVATEIFKKEIANFNGKVFIEETGFNNIDTKEQIAFLWSKKQQESELKHWHELLNKTLNSPRIEYRHLNKLTGAKTCPLLLNLPDEAVYLGFGPNDRLHRIHRDNESLNPLKLSLHFSQFSQFLLHYASFKTTV